MKKITSIILLLALAVSLTGCDERRFEYQELSITLPNKYKELEQEKDEKKYDLLVTDGDVIIGLNRISRLSAAQAGIPDALMPREFAEYYMKQSGIESDIVMSGVVPYYIYYNTPAGAPRQFCLIAFYRSEYAYFTLFCFVDQSLEADFITEIIDLIDNVTFSTER